MSALEASIENLTTEHFALTQKLEQIDQQYKVERPIVVGQIIQLAKALSALTGKSIAGPDGHTGRKPMTAEGKAAIKAGLERARAAKQAGTTVEGRASSITKPAMTVLPTATQTAASSTPPKKDVASEKVSAAR